MSLQIVNAQTFSFTQTVNITHDEVLFISNVSKVMGLIAAIKVLRYRFPSLSIATARSLVYQINEVMDVSPKSIV